MPPIRTHTSFSYHSLTPPLGHILSIEKFLGKLGLSKLARLSQSQIDIQLHQVHLELISHPTCMSIYNWFFHFSYLLTSFISKYVIVRIQDINYHLHLHFFVLLSSQRSKRELEVVKRECKNPFITFLASHLSRVLLGGNHRMKSFWDHVIQRISKKLDNWKGAYFSLGVESP